MPVLSPTFIVSLETEMIRIGQIFAASYVVPAFADNVAKCSQTTIGAYGVTETGKGVLMQSLAQCFCPIGESLVRRLGFCRSIDHGKVAALDSSTHRLSHVDMGRGWCPTLTSSHAGGVDDKILRLLHAQPILPSLGRMHKPVFNMIEHPTVPCLSLLDAVMIVGRPVTSRIKAQHDLAYYNVLSQSLRGISPVAAKAIESMSDLVFFGKDRREACCLDYRYVMAVLLRDEPAAQRRFHRFISKVKLSLPVVELG